jgi:hypothetical protein
VTLPCAQTEGLIGSILRLLGLAVPDHTTLSRRAATLEVPRSRSNSSGPLHLLVDSAGLKLGGPGGWLVEKHGTRARRAWRKLHLGVDADTGRIEAVELTTKEADDASRVGPLLDQVDGPVASLTGDGTCGRADVYGGRGTPPRGGGGRAAAPGRAAERGCRDRADAVRPPPSAHRRARSPGLAEGVRLQPSRFGRTAISRYKRVVGGALRSRTDGRQATEVAIAARALDRMPELGRPESVRVA